MSAKVLTIGEILVEIVSTRKGSGFLEPQPLIGPFPSGAPAIFIDQVSRLETPTAIISRVGDDDFGRLNLKRLAADGVDISAVTIAAGEATGSAFVRYRQDGGRAYVFNIAHSACGRLSATAAGERLLGESGHLHLVGSALSAPGIRELALNALETIKAQGGTLSFDPNLRPELTHASGISAALDTVLDHTDLFLPSGEELFLFSRAKGEESAVSELLERGVGEIVLKRGAAGASYFSRRKRCDVSAIAVPETDPTGAGDCFAGAFVSFWLRRAAPEVALYYANAAGARAVTRQGPMEGASTRLQLDTFLRQNMYRGSGSDGTER